MGIEYKIKFNIQSREKLEISLERILQNINVAEADIMPEFFVKLENDGFYFCDNGGDRTVVADTFYRLVGEALGQTSEVIIHEL